MNIAADGGTTVLKAGGSNVHQAGWPVSFRRWTN